MDTILLQVKSPGITSGFEKHVTVNEDKVTSCGNLQLKARDCKRMCSMEPGLDKTQNCTENIEDKEK
jgi:hypothetical protein